MDIADMASGLKVPTLTEDVLEELEEDPNKLDKPDNNPIIKLPFSTFHRSCNKSFLPDLKSSIHCNPVTTDVLHHSSFLPIAVR
jgi:hypothetical protein